MARSPKSDFKSRVLAFAQVSLKKKKKGRRETNNEGIETMEHSLLK